MRTTRAGVKGATVLGALALAAATAGAGDAAAKTVLKLSHYFPPVHGIHTDIVLPWTEQVSACTGEEVEFSIYPGGTQLGNVTKQQEQVLSGVVDIAVGLSGLPRGRFPRTTLIELPFVTDNARIASETLWELYPDYLAPEYPNLKVLALFAHNGGMLHTAETKVESMDDLKGLRLRTPSPAVSDMVTALGASPQGLPPSQIYENVQKHVIDGTVFPWDPIKSFGLNEVLNYHLEIEDGLYTVAFFFVMNERKFASLPDNVKACIDEASGAALVTKIGEGWNRWDAVGRQEAEQAGHVITTLDTAERDRWRTTLQPMIETYIDETSAQVENAREIYEAMLEAIENKTKQ